MCLTPSAIFLSECWWIVTALRHTADPKRVTVMSTKSLCHFCMGDWMPAWRPNSKTLLIFAHRLFFFSFLLPCRHQRLQQLDKLPGYWILHLEGNTLPIIPPLTEKVLWWSTCALALLQLRIWLVLFNSQVLPVPPFPGSCILKHKQLFTGNCWSSGVRAAAAYRDWH